MTTTSTPEALIKIPAKAVPLFTRWLKEHQQDMEEQFDELVRTRRMTPESRVYLAGEIATCKAALSEMEQAQTG